MVDGSMTCAVNEANIGEYERSPTGHLAESRQYAESNRCDSQNLHEDMMLKDVVFATGNCCQ